MIDFQIHRSLPKKEVMSNTLPISSIQNTTNYNPIGTGIVSSSNYPQQPINMQSTTPSVANGKDDMRGWLYKWTNVNKFIFISSLFFLLSKFSKKKRKKKNFILLFLCI